MRRAAAHAGHAICQNYRGTFPSRTISNRAQGLLDNGEHERWRWVWLCSDAYAEMLNKKLKEAELNAEGPRRTITGKVRQRGISYRDDAAIQ